MQKKTNENTRKDGYVAVIYVHGMGNQRRYEEVSQLVDSLDIYLSDSKWKQGVDKGDLHTIEPHMELSQNDEERMESFIEAKHHFNSQDKTARFYELYWAPIMARHSSAFRVLMWLFKRVPRPLETMRANWRDRQRLRRSTLMELFEHPEKLPAGVERSDIEEVLERYDKFASSEARDDFPEGTFEDFLDYLKEKSKDPDKLQRCIAISNLWRSKYRVSEAINLFQLVTLALLLVLLVGTVVGLLLFWLQQLFGWKLLGSLLKMLPAGINSTLQLPFVTVIVLLISLGGLIGLRHFLTSYMGDVESWATYEETDTKHERRKKVLARGVDLISHVLKDPNCRRVVVVSHSLGTAVAYDTLLAAARLNRAHDSDDYIKGPIPLLKIKHFVTFGSPIDKIHYLFESYKSHSHRYMRVVEDLRGDIGTPPFLRNRKPWIHWINYWDEADIISGALHSPANRMRFNHRVDNVHVSNLHFPDPAKSHLAYFDNRRIIGDLFDFIYKDKNNLRNAPLVTKEGSDHPEGRDYEGAFLETEEKPGRAKLFTVPAIITPWLFFFGLILRFLDINIGYMVFWSLAAFAAVFVFIGFLVGKMRGHRSPLRGSF